MWTIKIAMDFLKASKSRQHVSDCVKKKSSQQKK